MKKILLILCFVSITISGYAQGGEYEDVYGADVSSPKFNGGGLSKFYDFINKEFDFSVVKKSGKMVVSFTIDKMGTLKNIKVIDFNDMDSAKEIIRVLDISPKWECAQKNGKPFSVDLKLPLAFKVKKETRLTTIKPIDKSAPSLAEINAVPLRTNGKEVGSDNSIYEISAVEKRPGFPGGMQEFYNFIGRTYKSPNIKGLAGKVYVSFVVDTDGSIIDIKVLRDIGYGTGDEAIRVLSRCPKWNPGELKGVKVKVLYSLPISIKSS